MGYSCVGAVENSSFDYVSFLNTLCDKKVNFTRIFMVDPWANSGGYYMWAPFNKNGEGKYNLFSYNENFFARLKAFVELAWSKGIVVQVTIFDYCGLSYAEAWNRNLYNKTNNIHGGYFEFLDKRITDLSDPVVNQFHNSLVDRVLNAIGLCGNVIYEIMNEPDPGTIFFTGKAPSFHNTVAGWISPGSKDFNGDGMDDIFWRNYGADSDAGRNLVWYMNGTTYLGCADLPPISNTNWKIEGIGDFNGDKKPDIVWRYYGTDSDVGRNLVWYMNGAKYQGCVDLPPISNTNWKIEGIGDFNGDSMPDIIWRYYGADSELGKNLIWYLRRATYLDCAYPPPIANVNWKIQNH